MIKSNKIINEVTKLVLKKFDKYIEINENKGFFTGASHAKY